jgi:hypothetical protein
MNIQLHFNGDIEMISDKNVQRAVRKAVKAYHYTYAAEAAFLAEQFACFEDFRPEGQPVFRQTDPRVVGFLTDAPVITDGCRHWKYSVYVTKSFLKELEEGRNVVWKICN